MKLAIKGHPTRGKEVLNLLDMDHDITHCRGLDCPVKDTCYRYVAYVDAGKIGLEYISVLIQNKEEIEKEGKCHIYWPTKKYYGDDDSRSE